METNEKVKNTVEDLIERLDTIEYKLNLLLSNSNNTNKAFDEEYVNEARAAQMLNIARPTLSSWKSRGLIPFYKPEWSNKSFFKITDIKAIQTGVKHSSNKQIKTKATLYNLNKKK